MTNRVHTDRDEREGERRPSGEDEAPPPATRERNEGDGEERPEQAAPRIRVRHEPEEDTGRHPVPDTVGPEPCDPLEPEEQKDDEERLRRRLDRHPAQLEEPRGQSTEDDHDGRHKEVPRKAEREHAEQQHSREHEHGGQPACDALTRAGQLERTGEQVRIDGALVVVERPEEEREASAVLVAQPRGKRVGVERERGLVAVVPRRVRRRDPEVEGRDGENRTEPEE